MGHLVMRRSASLVCAFLALLPDAALATPEAHILRLDPRTSLEDGHPVVTTVIDLTEPRRLGEVLAPCARLDGDAALDCTSDALEKPGSLGLALPFPTKNALLTVKVDGRDVEAPFVDSSLWGESQATPGIGTGWVIILDADAHGAPVLDEFKRIAAKFVETLGANDLVNLVILSDASIVVDTRWLAPSQKKTALDALDALKEPFKSKGRTRPLLSLLKQATLDAFRGLGAPKEGSAAPLHQALIVLSTGYGGGDPATTGPGAEQLRQALSEGRHGDNNTALPKMPVPVISIMAPPQGYDEHRQLAREFMQSLPNPEIGGFFSVVRDGQPDHSARIIDTVRSRFARMVVARFRLSCVAPSITQSFSLVFRGDPQIAGDSSYKDVPLGFDPSEWPLDVDLDLTKAEANKNEELFPGGKLKVFGNFCWGGDLTRAEAYFVPPGEALPKDLSGETSSAKMEVQKRLIALDLRGTATSGNDSFVEFSIPDLDNLLHGEGDSAVVRLVLVDRVLKRTSGVSESTVLSLRAKAHPLPLLPIGLGAVATLVALGGFGAYLRRSNKGRARTSVVPPPRLDGSPYATPSPVTRTHRADAAPLRATLEGTAGRFVLLPGSDLRFGRDGARCAAVIANPQVSGLHATFKIDGGRVTVRDEGSSSGTRLDGRLLEAGRWYTLEDGSKISLGPETLTLVIGES